MTETFFDEISATNGKIFKWIFNEMRSRGFESLENLIFITSDENPESDISSVVIDIDDCSTDYGKIPLKLNNIQTFDSGDIMFYGTDILSENGNVLEISEYSSEDLCNIADFLETTFKAYDKGEIKLEGKRIEK